MDQIDEEGSIIGGATIVFVILTPRAASEILYDFVSIDVDINWIPLILIDLKDEWIFF